MPRSGKSRPRGQTSSPKEKGRPPVGLPSGLMAAGAGVPAVGCAVTGYPWPAVILALIGLLGPILVHVLAYLRCRAFGRNLERALVATERGCTVDVIMNAEQCSLSVSPSVGEPKVGPVNPGLPGDPNPPALGTG